MTLASGTAVGPYRIESPLDAGGMGEVYIAYDAKLNRNVALKLLPSDCCRDPERLRRFETEARAASGLNHPAIVAIYDLGVLDDRPYISMELVRGTTLRALVRDGPLPVRRALTIAAQIADGLAKAHEAGIVHRDVKPENLMVSEDGFAKILDFGLAKLTDDGAEAVHTVTGFKTAPGSVMGTAAYMSPEQASGRALDYRSDQFSFGLVLFEMLTGRRAFDHPSTGEQLAALIRDDPPALAELNPAIPAPLRWIVDRCLAKPPAERYAATRDLARDLANARDHFSELAHASSVNMTTGPAATSKRPWTQIVPWSMAAAFALALVAVLTSRPEPSPPPTAVRFTLPPPDGNAFAATVGATPFALSPSGQQLAFVAVDGNNERRLWIRSFDASASRSFAGTEGALSPFWSPDGRSVGFFAQGRLKKIDLASGDVAIICESRSAGGGTWNEDGEILFAPNIDTVLYRVAASGGTPTPVTTLDEQTGELAHVFPFFLPGGRRFVFSVIGGSQPGTHIATLDTTSHALLVARHSAVGFSAPRHLVLAGEAGPILTQQIDLQRLQPIGEPIRLAEDVDQYGPAFAASASEGGALVYAAGARTITQPTWFTRSGQHAGVVGPPGAYGNLSLSPDDRQVAIDRFNVRPAIWTIDVARSTLTRQTFSGAYEGTPLWSPNGRTLVFSAARSGPPNLFTKQVGASDDKLLLPWPYQSFGQSWSRDGKFIVFTTIQPETRADVYLIDMTADRKPRALLNTPFAEGHADISPDGRWMAYVSNESARNEVYVTRFPDPRGKWQVSTAGGTHAQWSRNGRELFYRAQDGKLMAVPIRAADDFDAGSPIPLFTPSAWVGGAGGGMFYDVAADGRFLINVMVQRTSPPASVVLNWPATIASTR